MLAYRGKQGCTYGGCTQAPFAREEGMCFGWHCGKCDKPCSSQGHECEEASVPKTMHATDDCQLCAIGPNSLESAVAFFVNESRRLETEDAEEEFDHMSSANARDHLYHFGKQQLGEC